MEQAKKKKSNPNQQLGNETLFLTPFTMQHVHPPLSQPKNQGAICSTQKSKKCQSILYKKTNRLPIRFQISFKVD